MTMSHHNNLVELNKTYYDAEEGEFSDGRIIDWFIWEPVNTAHVVYDRVCIPMSETYSLAQVRLPATLDITTNDVELRVPVAQFDNAITRTIKIPLDAESHGFNVVDLLERIHAFYMTPITAIDIADRDDDDRIESVRQRISTGDRVIWADLVGESKYVVGGADTENRREWCSCSGLVRFESMILSGNKLVLSLGS